MDTRRLRIYCVMNDLKEIASHILCVFVLFPAPVYILYCCCLQQLHDSHHSTDETTFLHAI